MTPRGIWVDFCTSLDCYSPARICGFCGPEGLAACCWMLNVRLHEGLQHLRYYRGNLGMFNVVVEKAQIRDLVRLVGRDWEKRGFDYRTNQTLMILHSNNWYHCTFSNKYVHSLSIELLLYFTVLPRLVIPLTIKLKRDAALID